MDDGFAVLERLVYAAGVRQKVIASNIANADTPGYRARDVDFSGLLDAEKIRLYVTDARHMGTQDAHGKTPGTIIPDTGRPWGDGNNVELDREMAKMTENGLFFEAGVTLMSAEMRIYRNAIRGR